MLNLNLTASERDALLETLESSHAMRIDVAIRDRDEKEVASLTEEGNRVISGSVQVDATADVSRSLNLTLLDPRHELRFDNTNPAKGALYADNFISVKYEVYVESLERWISIPVFWGVLTKFDRTGATVSVEAQGKESLLLAPHLATNAYTLRKGTKLQDAIKAVAARKGEHRFSIPHMKHGGNFEKLHKHISVLPEREPWHVIVGGDVDANGKKKPGLLSFSKTQRIAFYNGEGKLCIKNANQSPAFVFDKATLISPPTLSYDTLSFINTVVVKGGKAKGAQNHARGRASLPASNPISPYALRRNGKNRYLTQIFEFDGLKSDQACKDRAERILKSKANEGVSASFDCLPIPMLEEGDKVTLKTPEYSVTFPLTNFTIPLTSDAPMAINTNKRVRIGG